MDDGKVHQERLMSIAGGETQPDRRIPIEWTTGDIWEGMRAHDRVLADGVVEPCFEFMRAQPDPVRLKKKDLREYLEYREADFAKSYLSAMMRFSMSLHMTPEELSVIYPVDRNICKHMSVTNDIWSFDKEMRAAQTAHPEGGALSSAVSTFTSMVDIPTEGSKRILQGLCREWELVHDKLVKDVLILMDNKTVREYLKALQLQASGNEAWSKFTPRYRVSNI
ncbi:putative aristolochene synthase [Xylaria venustula]|nr:putative aristolochene synthase [Xylaria venustula]